MVKKFWLSLIGHQKQWLSQTSLVGEGQDKEREGEKPKRYATGISMILQKKSGFFTN